MKRTILLTLSVLLVLTSFATAGLMTIPNHVCRPVPVRSPVFIVDIYPEPKLCEKLKIHLTIYGIIMRQDVITIGEVTKFTNIGAHSVRREISTIFERVER